MILPKYSGKRLNMFARTWALFFCVISIACFAMLFSVIRSNENIIHELQVSHGQVLIDQVVDVEEFIRGFDVIGEKLAASEGLRELSMRSDIAADEEQVGEVFDKILKIYNWNAARPYKQLAFVYLPKSGLIFDVLSHIVFTDSDEILPRINMDKKSWDRFLNAKEETIVDTIWDGDMDFARLMMAQEVAKDVILVTGIAADNMADILKTSQLPAGSQIMLITQSSEEITYVDEETQAFECPYEWKELQELPDIGKVTIEGRDYYQYHILMLDGKLHQLAFVPVDTYGEIASWKLLGIFFVSWLLGIPCSLLLSKVVYRPIQNLFVRLSSFHQNKMEKEDEIAFIERTITELEEKTKSYENQLDLQKKQFQDLLFLRVMKGQCKSSETFFQICGEKGIDCDEKEQCLVLAAVRMDTFDGYANAQGALESYMYLETKRQTYETEFKDTAHYLLSDGNILLGVFSFKKSQFSQEIERLGETRRNIGQSDAPTFSVMVSSPFANLEELSNAYNQILELLHEMDWSGAYDVLLVYDAFVSENQQAQQQEDLLGLLQDISNHIQNGAFSLALPMVRKICVQIASAPQHFAGQISIESAFTALNLIQAFEVCAVSDGEGEMARCLKNMQIHSRLATISSVSELQKQAEEILNRLREVENIETENERHIRIAVEYIQEHYKDPSLSAGAVAQVTGMMPSAFSKAFKQSMNITYLEYVHRLRIDAAKKLLISGQFNLNEIAEQVGYTNTVTMNRAFKRYENTTPGKWR